MKSPHPRASRDALCDIYLDTHRTLQFGLMRYLARTSAAKQFALTYTPTKSTDSANAATAPDPWNAWVFSVSANGNGNREENYSGLYANGRLAANRVTDEWKTSLSVGENYNESRFSFNGETSLFVQRSYSANLLEVKSLGDHWSAGVKGNFNSSTYLNQHASTRLTPRWNTTSFRTRNPRVGSCAFSMVWVSARSATTTRRCITS